MEQESRMHESTAGIVMVRTSWKGLCIGSVLILLASLASMILSSLGFRELGLHAINLPMIPSDRIIEGLFGVSAPRISGTLRPMDISVFLIQAVVVCVCVAFLRRDREFTWGVSVAAVLIYTGILGVLYSIPLVF